MMASSPSELGERAEAWAATLRKSGINCDVVDGESTVGGGSLPGETLPTRLVAFNVSHANRLLTELRKSRPPIIARIEEDQLVLDPRTVLSHQDDLLLAGIQEILNKPRFKEK